MSAKPNDGSRWARSSRDGRNSCSKDGNASKNERGFAALEFVAGLAILLLPVAVLVTVMPTWSERQEIATVAAREAARTYVVTHDRHAAEDMVTEIAHNYRLAEDQLKLTLTGDPTARGGRVEASVNVKVPATAIPVLGANSDAFSFTEHHTEIVDLYRNAS
jgi:Flp pilus assembly protein TadG